MIRLYDTAAREKRAFEPADPSRVTMYVCGPTVYGRAHIGNMRPAVVFDVLRRLLEHSFPEREVIFARNITDVDDKIMAAAAEEGVPTSVITERFERFYLADTGALGVREPTIAPHATAEIDAMVTMIAALIDKGHAYSAEGHVLFDVASDADYGALSRRDREAMLAGARVEVAPYKRAPGDFVLWKPSSEEQVGWDSPWGRGRPGWHIECSAMIRRHLGETIDIHGGGIDLVFPHHENEAAQSRCAHDGAPLARFWLHNGFVDFGAEKMSKSLGNVVTPEELFAAGYKGEVLRLGLLSAHYRSPLPWTSSILEWAKRIFERYERALEFDRNIPVQVSPELIAALEDDLNTPLALRVLESHIKAVFNFWAEASKGGPNWQRYLGYAAQAAANVRESGRLLGLPTEMPLRAASADEARIQELIDARAAAKKARDFATSDRIRDELKAEGILLEDGPAGTTWRRA